MIKNQSIIKTNEFLIKLSFFCIAFRFEITSVCVFIMFFLSLYEIIKNKINIFKKLNFTILFFFLYFAVDLIGILYSENKSFGFKDLESKLFFLIVPIIFLSNKFKIEIIYKSLKYFIVGTSILLMIHYWHGLLYFIKFDSIPNYVYFSYHIHPTYFSIYLLISIILLLKLKNNLAISINWMYYFFLIMLSFGIILSNSKAGTLTFLIYLLIEIIKFLLKQKKIYLITSLSVLIFMSMIIFQKLENSRFSELKTSFNFPYQTEYNGVYNSTQIRIIIWRSVKEIILNKPFFGTGTGDIKDELKNEFIKIKFQNGIENKYNCHNQYFQIIATFGMFLGSLILIIFTLSIYQQLINKNYTLFIFNMIIVFNLLFESIFESKAGIEFIVLLNLCLLFSYAKKTS